MLSNNSIIVQGMHKKKHILTAHQEIFGSEYGYKQQDHINPYRMEMASAVMIHFGLDPGKVICFLLGKYTCQHWDIRCTLGTVQDSHQTITIISNLFCFMVAPLNLPLRNIQATSWVSYLVVIPRVLLRIRSWFKKHEQRRPP
jgi:hypothetical protein